MRLTVIRRALRDRVPRGDHGNAILIVLMVTMVLTLLGTTAGVLAANNTQNAGLDRAAGTALQVSEGGVAQAMAWMQFWGPNSLACSPTCSAGTYRDWGDGPDSPTDTSYGHTVNLGNGRQYVVWIERVSDYSPPATRTGLYTVHSIGRSKSASPTSGTRALSVDVTVKPFEFPIGVFARQVQAGGNGGIHNTSIFSSECIAGRNKIDFANAVDAYYGVPAGAHAAKWIVTADNDSCTVGNSIHQAQPCTLTIGTGSNVQVTKNDSDAAGGTLTSGDGCRGNGTLNGSTWLTTSKETSAQAMEDMYGFKAYPNGLSNTQLDALRTAAVQQGFYFTGTTTVPSVLNASNAWQTYPHPILFYDLKGTAVGGEVDLNDLGGYSRPYPVAANSAQCTPYGAVVVVLNGNVKLNSNTVLVANVFAPGPSPYGVVRKATGGGQLIGTIFADQVDLRGSADVYLDECFLANMTSLWSMTQSNFREEDR